MQTAPMGLTIPEATHYRAAVNGADLHYVLAGDTGSPVLLVHGFPESWWAFHKLIPLLARHHRVIAVDLRGFGDSSAADAQDNSETTANDLHALIEHLGFGPVHLVVQDISGATGFRLATSHAENLLSFTGVETGLAGFGLELLADVAKGGAWYIGILATPGAADAFFNNREKTLIGEFIMPFATAVPDAVKAEDVAELARGYARKGGWTGARTLYGSMLHEGDAIRETARKYPLTLPTMAVDRGGSDFTLQGLGAVHHGLVVGRNVDGTGHYIAMEAPGKLADTLLAFFAEVGPERS